jgi:hypothetical protein
MNDEPGDAPGDARGMMARLLAAKRRGHPLVAADTLADAVRSQLHNLRLLNGTAPPFTGSWFFRIGNVEYLAYREAARPTRFELFATVYHLPAGRVDLDDTPPPHRSILGYEIDFAPVAARLRQLSSALPPPRRRLRDRFWPVPPGRILLWGFIDNLGHHLWNEQGGLDLLLADGGFDRIDEVWLGPFDFFGLAPFFSRRFPVRRCAGLEPPVASPELLLRSAEVVFSSATRQRVLAWARGLAAGSRLEHWLAAGRAGPVVCVQIRRHHRRWLEEEAGVVALITALACRWPSARFILDGMSATAAPDARLAAELAAGHGILHALPAGLPVYCAIGEELNAKIRAFAAVDLFVAPLGSGNTISSWLLQRPTIVHGPTTHYAFCQEQERCVPEGGGTGVFVPPSHITEATGQDYHLDWRLLAEIAGRHLAGIIATGPSRPDRAADLTSPFRASGPAGTGPGGAVQ